jgi:prevent-host-death family protein
MWEIVFNDFAPYRMNLTLYIVQFLLLFLFDFLYNITKKIVFKFVQGGIIMFISATEFKNNLGKYLTLAAKEDIYITKNGKSIAKLTSPTHDKVEMAKSLFGILPGDASLEQAREERLSRHERVD